MLQQPGQFFFRNEFFSLDGFFDDGIDQLYFFLTQHFIHAITPLSPAMHSLLPWGTGLVHMFPSAAFRGARTLFYCSSL